MTFRRCAARWLPRMWGVQLRDDFLAEPIRWRKAAGHAAPHAVLPAVEPAITVHGGASHVRAVGARAAGDGRLLARGLDPLATQG